MTTPSGAITANDVSSELGRLVVPFSGSAIDTFSDRITVSDDYIGYGNRLANGDAVVYVSNNGTAIGGLSNNTTYYVINANTTTLRLSSTPGGANVDITSTGTGTHYLTRTSAVMSMNDERVIRLCNKTSATDVSFDTLRNQSATKTYDSGTTTSSKRRLASFGGGERNWNKYANGAYFINIENDNNAFNSYSLDYFVYDVGAYANASIQSDNLVFTWLVSHRSLLSPLLRIGFGIIPFIKPAVYNTTAEPGAVTITDFGNQNGIKTFSLSNTYSADGYTWGNLVVSFPLQTGVSFGSVGGWSISNTRVKQPGQWNTSKLSNTLHAVSLVMECDAGTGGVSNDGQIRFHSCRMNGSYVL